MERMNASLRSLSGALGVSHLSGVIGQAMRTCLGDEHLDEHQDEVRRILAGLGDDKDGVQLRFLLMCRGANGVVDMTVFLTRCLVDQ